jgi:hypothetical protein
MKTPACWEPGLSAGRFECGGAGAARLMSHHMGNFVHARDDEYLPLAACFAFERATFDVSCVHRLDQSDRSLPAARGASSSGAHGGRLGGMHVVSFPVEPSASPRKVQVRLGLSLCRLTNRVCAILTTSPALELKTIAFGSGGGLRLGTNLQVLPLSRAAETRARPGFRRHLWGCRQCRRRCPTCSGAVQRSASADSRCLRLCAPLHATDTRNLLEKGVDVSIHVTSEGRHRRHGPCERRARHPRRFFTDAGWAITAWLVGRIFSHI